MKKKLGATNCLYPMPTVLVGANVKSKPNYITIAHVGIMDFTSISVSMAKFHHTNAGIKENMSFSVNIPSAELVKVTDYCGIFSGKNVDKGQLFKTFYGELKTAPMIQECPINMECRVIQTLDFPKHDIFIGEILETYCDQKYLTEGVVDFSKVQPLLFAMNDKSYWKVGDRLGKAWSIGKDFGTHLKDKG